MNLHVIDVQNQNVKNKQSCRLSFVHLSILSTNVDLALLVTKSPWAKISASCSKVEAYKVEI